MKSNDVLGFAPNDGPPTPGAPRRVDRLDIEPRYLLIEVCILLSTSEERVLHTFHEYLMTPGKMLCFSGPDLERFSADLSRMTDKKLLVKEKFKGGYSLTRAGFDAMKDCIHRDHAGVSTPNN